MTDNRPPSTPLLGDIDDVALAHGGDGRLWICASWATLQREGTWLAAVHGHDIAAPTPIAANDRLSFRPAVTGIRDGALAVACAPGGALLGITMRSSADLQRWSLDVGGDVWHVSVTTDAVSGGVWLAYEARRQGERWVDVGVLDPDTGAFVRRLTVGGGDVWCRWPAVVAPPEGGCVVAWCAGRARSISEIHCGRVDARGGLHTTALIARGDSPALAMARSGRVAIAWHSGGAAWMSVDANASAVRTVHAASWSHDGIQLLQPPRGDTDAAGEDQGWELPAIAVDRDDRIWLAGRSSHGHHVAVRDSDGRWSQRQSVCRAQWGGRGRRLALCVTDDVVWMARRAPDGLDLRPLQPPPPLTSTTVAAPASRGGPPAARRTSSSVLFGDLHQHTAHSDGCGSVEDLWVAARDGRQLDFAAVTDHDRFCRRTLGPATWQYMCRVADDFDEPGRFAAFPAYEFTGARHPGPGHKCVYFGDRVPDRIPDKDVATLLATVRAHGGIAVPHHVGWTGGDFSHHDEAVQPVWEICSVHGCYEAAGCGGSMRPPRQDCVLPGQFIRDALDAGLRFGFIGSTDSHGLDWHHGVYRRRNPFSSGLAGVVDAEPTREAILAALRARRAYATSGARIVVRFELDGAPMGSALPASTKGTIRVEVEGTAPVRRVALVSADREEVIVDAAGSHRCAATARWAAHGERVDYVYARVEQADGEMAWVSPIWFG